MFFMNPSSDIIEFTLYPVNFFSSDLAPCLASLSTMLTSLSLVLSFFFAILFSFSSMFSLRIRLICLFFSPTFPPILSDFCFFFLSFFFFFFFFCFFFFFFFYVFIKNPPLLPFFFSFFFFYLFLFLIYLSCFFN